MMREAIRLVDPRDLRMPPSRSGGADPWKLHQQIRQFGESLDAIPPILVYEDPEGNLEIMDGVTRAFRAAKLAAGRLVPVIVIGRYERKRPDSVLLRDLL